MVLLIGKDVIISDIGYCFLFFIFLFSCYILSDVKTESLNNLRLNKLQV